MPEEKIGTFDADTHDQETKKSYYQTFDDKTVNKLKNYYKVDDNNHDTLLRYLKDNKVPPTTPDHT